MGCQEVTGELKDGGSEDQKVRRSEGRFGLDLVGASMRSGNPGNEASLRA